MGNVKSTVKLNQAALSRLDKKFSQALGMTADATLTEIKNAGVMPFNQGTLQNDSTFVDDKDKDKGKVSIVSSTPYARRLYYHPEYNFRTTFNHNAGGKWFDDYIKNGFVNKAFSQILKGMMK